MPNKNPIPIQTKQQIAKEEARQDAQELRWIKQLNRHTRHNRREAAHAEEQAQLRDALSRSEQSNAQQRIFERRCRLGANTVRHLAILLALAMVLLNDLADKVICIPAIGVMLFVVGFDMARVWIEFICWLVSPKKRKSGGK